MHVLFSGSFNTQAMKKIIILVAFIIVAATLQCIAQVSISPEIGVSYLPFAVYSHSMARSNRIDYLLGISGSLPISEKWYVNTRISYCKRERVKWWDSSIEQGWNSEYIHSDLNIDFSANYRITEIFHVGAGPVVIRKINTSITSVGDRYGQSYTYSGNGFQYGVQSAFSTDFRFFILKLEYARKIFNFERNIFYNGKDRFNMTLAVPIAKREKR